ncbi:3-hydroxyacyl-CoA dehydrogenase family protein, partial [Streptomyces sp. B6B3]|uniref:3-hydroxyacyl-CoA dehydrogenase family protein n=1 Tax=Streptomyces sp. B6B3 TaxID=3153570 RepID=UPI00325E368A
MTGTSDSTDSTPPLGVVGVVGVVGAGQMGVGVAACFARAGHPVTVVDPSADARTSAPKRLRQGLRHAMLSGGEKVDLAAVAARVRWTDELDALGAATFVVECAVERQPVKEDLFRRLGRLCPPGTILASCTSAIPIASLAAVTGHQDRVLGTHFMNPAPAKPAVEVVRAETTSEETLRRTTDLLVSLGKSPIVVSDGPGFVTNRVLMLTVNEAATVVHQGTASPATVDRIFRDCFGHPTGPLATADLIGLDTIVDTLNVLHEHTS